MTRTFSLCRVLLFLLASWIIYNSLCISWIILNLDNVNKPKDFGLALKFVYLLGIEDLELLQIVYTILLRPLYHTSVFLFIGFLVALFIINAIPAYLWCRKQTLPRAWLLAVIGGVAGPCAIFAWDDFGEWLYAMGLTFLFYLVFVFANVYRKKSSRI